MNETLFPAALFHISARNLGPRLRSQTFQGFLSLRAVHKGIPPLIIQPRLDLSGQTALGIAGESLLRLLKRLRSSSTIVSPPHA